MSKHLPPFVAALEKRDPELFAMMQQLVGSVMAPGALDVKTKVLISIAVDAISGANKGVQSLAAIARKMGISDEEIKEALRVAQTSVNMQFLATMSAAFEDK